MSERANKRRNVSVFLLFFLMFVSFLMSTGAASVSVRADTKSGFVTENSQTYYYRNGQKVTGWLRLGKKTYYFFSDGRMARGWQVDAKGDRRYFNDKGVMQLGWSIDSTGRRFFNRTNGVMVTGWAKIGGQRYFFIPETGYAATGLYKVGQYYRYFEDESGMLTRGWKTSTEGDVRYFKTAAKVSADGAMVTGFVEIEGSIYYFRKASGKMLTGWQQLGKKKYYFGADGKMAMGVVTIDGVQEEFSQKGVYIGNYVDTSQDPTGEITTDGSKTIKNYLLGALIPVGKVLYVWGGGWNDSTRKGISSTQIKWYNSQSKSYDYHNWNDLSVANRAKGFDCSGFVGWAAYQVMHQTSNEGGGYTVVSGEVGSTYKARGWGNTFNQNYLSSNGYVLKAGDIGYNDGHVWIVIGQCKDKSVVIVHSTPQAGVQISGTATPSGEYNSEAVALATKYMSLYSGSIAKYDYHHSAGNYIPRYNYFRWNRSTLADPDGYMSKYADAILADLFASIS